MNILITTGARRIDFIEFFKNALKEAGISGNIVVVDSDYNAPSLQAADYAYVVPKQADDDYIDELLKVCKEREVDVLVPLNDLEAPKIAASKQLFTDKGITVLAPDQDIVDKVRDKGKYTQLLGPFGLKTPKTYFTVEETEKAIKNNEVDFPFIVKPRNGSGSIAMEIVHNLDQLNSAYKLAVQRLEESVLDTVTDKNSEDNVLIQEVIEGEKYSLDVVNDQNGNYLTSFARKQLAMRGGDIDKTITSNNEDILSLGRKLGENLKHEGYLNTDVFYDGKEYYVIDINPRFGGGYAFSHAAGANIPAAYIASLAGKEIKQEWLESTPDVELARYDVVTQIDETKVKYKNS
ncbi:ATP-grasp domain-containing protein [Sediminibacillus massiliensis]|uniref:ATP-grasp domain-containing protein n=1 Tax=Sediminibacillus massiliensis TaxID=1926277 RepID=UPI0009886415|nr:ATP-grasp domain-containing protein [Sediminibacillus massiliensis]